MQKYNPLTPEESRIIIGKWTEAPYSWEYENHHETGNFICRQCDAVLFTSEMKFDSGCGWPSFDDALPGRVTQTLDTDGRRTEITCTNCGGHLGHVFVGERFTPKNTRHCVNSLSMKFVKEIKETQKLQKAYFGGGCFWCLDAVFTRIDWVTEVKSGYMWGRIPNPTYERVCSWVSGYIEVVEITYDASSISYEFLLDVFFATHDPTTRDQQDNDSGEQYRSVIFGTPEELSIAKNYIDSLQKDEVFENPIVTELRDMDIFYIAEEHHQDYYADNSDQGYCQYVINPKLAKLREKFTLFLKK